MKKFLKIFCALMLAVSLICFVSCGDDPDPNPDDEQMGPPVNNEQTPQLPFEEGWQGPLVDYEP